MIGSTGCQMRTEPGYGTCWTERTTMIGGTHSGKRSSKMTRRNSTRWPMHRQLRPSLRSSSPGLRAPCSETNTRTKRWRSCARPSSIIPVTSGSITCSAASGGMFTRKRPSATSARRSPSAPPVIRPTGCWEEPCAVQGTRTGRSQRSASPLLSIPTTPSPRIWHGPWPREAGWRRPAPPGRHSCDATRRIMTRGTAMLSCAVPR